MASASVGQPLDTQEPTRVVLPDFLHCMIQFKEEHLRRIKEHWTAERDVAMKLGGKTTEIVSPEKLLQDINSTEDAVQPGMSYIVASWR